MRQLILVRGKRKLRPSRSRAWSIVGLMILLIFVMLPMTPFLWERGVALIGTEFHKIGYVVSFLLLIFLGSLMVRHRRRHGLLNIAALAALGLVYAYWLRYQCKFPAERLHLIEYGFLAFFSYQALSIDFSRLVSLALAFLFSCGIGITDELIQYALPNRKCELRDIMTNLIGAGLGILVVALLKTGSDRVLPE